MKPVSSSTSGLNLNTDRIATASKQPQKNTSVTEQPAQAKTFNREIPFSPSAEFVEADGKRYFLNAPRGTYVNLLV